MTNEELFEKYSIRLSLAYEAGGMGTVKHWDYLMTKDGFLQAIDEVVKSISSKPVLSADACDHDRHYSEIDGFAYCNKCGTPMQ